MQPEIHTLLETPELPGLGPGPRPGVLPLNELEGRLAAWARDSQARQLMRALILLWHDQLDAAHRIAQQVETPDGSYVHAIMHRREPDFGNSKYWFRRTGRHPAFDTLARGTVGLLREDPWGADLQARLIPGGAWDPCAFVDLCEAVTAGGDVDAQVLLLRRIQAVETMTLVEFLEAS